MILQPRQGLGTNDTDSEQTRTKDVHGACVHERVVLIGHHLNAAEQKGDKVIIPSDSRILSPLVRHEEKSWKPSGSSRVCERQTVCMYDNKPKQYNKRVPLVGTRLPSCDCEPYRRITRPDQLGSCMYSSTS